MSGQQKFVLGISGLVILLLIVVTICFILGVSSVTNVLESPAATSNISISKLTVSTPEGHTITIEGFSSELNSKLVDLLLLAISD